VAVDDDERRAVVLAPEGVEGAAQTPEVVGVADADDLPAIGPEAGGDVLGEGERGLALDRDPVVVVDPAEVRELQVAGQRRGLARDPLHHAAVAGKRVDVVVEQLEAGTVEVGGLPLGGDGHADRGGDALPERAGRRLDAARPAVLGMARAAGLELAEALEILERDGGLADDLVRGVDRTDAGEVEHRVEQRRGVPSRQHEAVAVGPDRVVGVVAQVALPQLVGDGRHGHGRSGVAGARLLDGVHGERADGGDRQLVEGGEAVRGGDVEVFEHAANVRLAAPARIGDVPSLLTLPRGPGG
jgi:hypothetical protein